MPVEIKSVLSRGLISPFVWVESSGYLRVGTRPLRPNLLRNGPASVLSSLVGKLGVQFSARGSEREA